MSQGCHPHCALESPVELYQDCGCPGDTQKCCVSRCPARLRAHDVGVGPPLPLLSPRRVCRCCENADSDSAGVVWTPESASNKLPGDADRPGPGEHTLNSKAEGDPVSLEDGPSPYPELVLLSLGLESVGTTHTAPGSPNPGDYFCCNRESQLGTCLPSVLTGLGRLD